MMLGVGPSWKMGNPVASAAGGSSADVAVVGVFGEPSSGPLAHGYRCVPGGRSPPCPTGGRPSPDIIVPNRSLRAGQRSSSGEDRHIDSAAPARLRQASFPKEHLTHVCVRWGNVQSVLVFRRARVPAKHITQHNSMSLVLGSLSVHLAE